jgi:hypothetical protein
MEIPKENEQGSFETGQDEQVAPTIDDTPVEETTTADDIAARLSENEAGEAADAEEVMQSETPLAFDISKLSTDQLQQLKQALAVTPDTRRRTKANPVITMRRMDGDLIVDHKPNAFKAVVFDSINRRDVEKFMLPVKFLNKPEWTDVGWQEFMEAERVNCEVVSVRHDPQEIVEGETISRETNQPVEMVKTIIHDWFTIKLPEQDGGGTIEVEARIVNA